MNKLDVVKFLIKEMEEEKELLSLYLQDTKQANNKAVKEEMNRRLKGEKNIYCSSWKYREYKGKVPSKTKIREIAKKVRQLMLEISKEI